MAFVGPALVLLHMSSYRLHAQYTPNCTVSQGALHLGCSAAQILERLEELRADTHALLALSLHEHFLDPSTTCKLPPHTIHQIFFFGVSFGFGSATPLLSFPVIFRPCSSQVCMQNCKPRVSQTTGGFWFGIGAREEYKEDVTSKHVRQMLFDVIPEILHVTVESVASLGQAGSFGASTAQPKLLGTTRRAECAYYFNSTKETIRKQMRHILNTILAKFPQLFIDSVLKICKDMHEVVVARREVVFSSLLEILGTLDMATPEVVLRSTVSAFEEQIGVPSAGSSCTLRIRESCIMHFLYSYVSASTDHCAGGSSSSGVSSTANAGGAGGAVSGGGGAPSGGGGATSPAAGATNESYFSPQGGAGGGSRVSAVTIPLSVLWKHVARIVSATAGYSKQPMTVLWTLSLIQLADAITHTRNQGKKTKFDLSACMDVRQFKKDVAMLVQSVVGSTPWSSGIPFCPPASSAVS